MCSCRCPVFSDISASKLLRWSWRFSLFNTQRHHQTALSKSWNTCRGEHRRHSCLDGARMYFKNFPVAFLISSSIDEQSLAEYRCPCLRKLVNRSWLYAKHLYSVFCYGYKSVLCSSTHQYLSLLWSAPLHAGEFIRKTTQSCSVAIN